MMLVDIPKNNSLPASEKPRWRRQMQEDKELLPQWD
jgi:hypothetical protein